MKKIIILVVGLWSTFLVADYQENGNGTVIDITNKIMWMSCSVGQELINNTCKGKGNRLTWNQSKNININFSGYNDWRLPTIEELSTLVYCSNKDSNIKLGEGDGCGNLKEYQKPTINTNNFPNTPISNFWSSSTPNKDYSSFAWLIYFGNGSSDYYFRHFKANIRLVRTIK